MRTLWSSTALVLVPVVLAFAVYRSLTTGYFFGDDFHVLYWLTNNGPAEYYLAPYGGHIQITRNVMFSVVNRAAGPNPAAYYWVALLTHLTNVVLLFLIIRDFTGSARLACFGAALFGMSPLDEGALSWLSVYGHVVATTAALIVLYRVGHVAERHDEPSPVERAAWYGLALVSALSFGVGIGTAMALPLVAALLLPWRRSGRYLPPLAGLWFVLPVLYLILNLIYSSVSDRSLGTVVPLDTYSATAMVTLSAVAHLIAYGATQLILGFLYSPSRYPDAIAAVCAVLLAIAYVGGLIWSPPRRRRQLMAAGLLVAATYGMIAFGRGVFFTTGGGYASQPRYHYMGASYLALVVCLLLNRAADWPFAGESVKNGLLILWLIWAVVSWRATGWDFDHREKDRRGTDRALAAMRAEIARAPRQSAVYIENRPFGRFGHFVGMADFPGWAALFTIYFPSNVVDSRPIYFVEDDQAVREAAARGRRTSTLIVAPTPAAEPAGDRGRDAAGE